MTRAWVLQFRFKNVCITYLGTSYFEFFQNHLNSLIARSDLWYFVICSFFKREFDVMFIRLFKGWTGKKKGFFRIFSVFSYIFMCEKKETECGV